MALFGLCEICHGNDLQGGEDGYFYCSRCGSQSQQFQEQALDLDEGPAYTKRRANVIVPEKETGGILTEGDDPDAFLQSSQPCLYSKVGITDAPRPWETGGTPSKDHASHAFRAVDPMETMDADSAAIRSLYIEGLQCIMQLQCETLLQSFHVSPLVCAVFGPIWLHFVAFTRVLEKDWGREALQLEEARNEERKRSAALEKKKRKTEGMQPVGKGLDKEARTEGMTSGSKQKQKKGTREEMQSDEEKLNGSKDSVQMKIALRFIWLNALKDRIPLAASLAIVFLACHIIGEAILPTDIVHWALRGTLPYLAAFKEVEKRRNGLSWPIEPRVMFKPADVVGAKKLEFMAASIAIRIGLCLPPVNFDALSYRFLKDLNLPADKLSNFVRRIFDWYKPPGLYLSDKAHALPTRVYVMAMVMITLKILYKIDGRPYQKTKDVQYVGVGSTSDWLKHDNQPQIKTNDTIKRDISEMSGPQDVVKDGLENSVGKDTGISCMAHSEILKERDDMWSKPSLLEKLEEVWKNCVRKPFDCENETSSYIEYCQNFIFTGLKIEREEESLCEHLRTLYEHSTKQEDAVSQRNPVVPDIPEVQSLSEDSHISLASFHAPGSQKEDFDMMSEDPDLKVENTPCLNLKDKSFCEKGTECCSSFSSLEKFLYYMETFGFECLAPRKAPVPKSRYLTYSRRRAKSKGEIAPLQLVHADYFMVLSVCAHLIKVHPSSLHWCIQRMEKSLLGMHEKAKDSSKQTE